MSNIEERQLFNQFKECLNSHPISREFDYITSEIFKKFSSCCDYHCEELLKACKAYEKELSDLDNSPILYIVCKLRTMISIEEAKLLPFSECVYINWDTTTFLEDEEDNLYNKKENQEYAVLEAMSSKWETSYMKLDEEHYSVKFPKENYDAFKAVALELAKPYYLFEGDVLDILRVQKEIDEIVELMPLNLFDICNTIAKILGLRKDY